MSLRVFRLCRRKYVPSAFDGTGARLFGGRWNPPGIAVVYTSATVSLAALETFVHVDAEDAPDDLVVIPADVPDRVGIRELPAAALPRGWRRTPAPPALARLGARWVQDGRSAVLAVPSAIVPQERNYLLNPAHPDMRHLLVGRPQRFAFDPRMWK